MSFTLLTVLAGTTLLGIVGGVVGCFAFLRRQSLLGDALAHAALPGVCLAFLLTQSKSPEILAVGALVTGLIGAVAIDQLVDWSRLKQDAAMGIVLSVFFGLGIVLLTRIQRMPLGNQSGLDHFLFGQAATLLPRDVALIAVVGVAALMVVALLLKELGAVAFDAGWAASSGLPVRRLELVLTGLLVVVVVTGLKAVGVVLMVAALVTPAAAARQWTNRLGTMLMVAGSIGALSGGVGSWASASFDRLPTGPVVVLVSTSILVVSLLFSPARGVVWTRLRARQVAQRIRDENLLKDLWSWGERRDDFERPVSLPRLMGGRGQRARELWRLLGRVRRSGLVREQDEGMVLTAAGRRAAENVVRKHRVWEVYLTRRMDLASDHVHRDAEAMEHALSDEAVEDLWERLGRPLFDPHGRTIPWPNGPSGPDRAAADGTEESHP